MWVMGLEWSSLKIKEKYKKNTQTLGCHYVHNTRKEKNLNSAQLLEDKSLEG